MSILPFKKKKDLVGIDLGSGAIKALCIKKSGKSYVVDKVGVAELPEGAFQNGIISDVGAISDTLNTLWENLELKNISVALAVPGREVVIDMPRLENVEPDAVYSYIRSNPMDFIPYPLEEVYFDCEVIDLPEGDMDNYLVLLACVKKAILMDFRRVVEKTGITVSVIDVDFFALCNSFETLCGRFDPERVIMLLNFGYSSIGIVIAHNGVPVYFRSIANGAEEIAFQLSDAFGISYRDSISFLKGFRVDKPIDDIKAKEVIKYVVDQWFSEIKHNIDYFMELQNIAGIDEVYICGGLACAAGFDNMVGEYLQVPCKIFNPMDYVQPGKNVDPDYLKAVGPQLAVSFGLALRKTGDKKA